MKIASTRCQRQKEGTDLPCFRFGIGEFFGEIVRLALINSGGKVEACVDQVEHVF
jgi:hypothetical protein